MLGITGKGQGGAKVGAKVGANIMRNTLNEKYIKGAFCFFPSYRQLEEHLCRLPECIHPKTGIPARVLWLQTNLT
jgi:hypothetical protein